ncbi:MAG: hypothetical protein KJZ59_04285, partial [Pararhodobacter sp.]|nr:hypothetical protein [Pararhodobacter sp.]
MTRFCPTPALTALALGLAAAAPATAQDQTADSYIPQAPVIPLHELIPSEADEAAAAAFDAPLRAEDAEGDFAEPPVLALPDLEVLPIGPPPGGGVALDPEAPAAVFPEGWQPHSHFGLSFALPAGFTLEDLENDASDGEGLIGVYTGFDPETFVGQGMLFGFLPPEMADGFVDEMVGEFGLQGAEALEAPVSVAGLSLAEHVGSGVVEQGMSVHARALVGDAPLGNGLRPFFVLVRSNMDPEVAEAVEAAFLASVSIPDPALLGLPDPEPFRDGLMTYRILPGWRASGGISPEFQWINLGGRHGSPRLARLILADVGTRTWSMRNFLQDDFRDGPTRITEGMLDGVPVWIIEGQPAFTLSGSQRTAEGDDWRRYSLVTQVCLPERGPLAASLVTTEDRITSDLTPEAVLADLRLHLPPEAGPCPATVTDAVTEAMRALRMPGAVAPDAPDPTLQLPDGPTPPPPPVAATPDPQPPRAPPPPVVDAGIPDTPAPGGPDPEAEAWARILAEPTVDATHAYLRAWPNGAHAAQARDWLAARGIVPPGVAPVPPPAVDHPAPDPEAEAWARISAEPTVDATYAYLQAWPNGAHAAQARDWLIARGIVPPGVAPV